MFEQIKSKMVLPAFIYSPLNDIGRFIYGSLHADIELIWEDTYQYRSNFSHLLYFLQIDHSYRLNIPNVLSRMFLIRLLILSVNANLFYIHQTLNNLAKWQGASVINMPQVCFTH